MSVTSWGKCDIYVQEVGSKKNEWDKLPTPKDGTTTVTPTKGDIMTQVAELLTARQRSPHTRLHISSSLRRTSRSRSRRSMVS